MGKTAKRTAVAGPQVRVAIDPALKKAYDMLLAIIAETSRKEATDFDRRWEAAGRIVDHDPPLYVVGGYRDAAAFFRGAMHEEPRTAARYVRVARFASAAEEAKYGVAKLDAALGLVEAKLGRALAHAPLPIRFDRLRIPVGGGTKGLESATVAEIRRATAALTKPSRKRPKTPVQKALSASLARVGSLAEVEVHEHAGRLTIRGIPIAAFQHFLRALHSAKLPAAPAKRSR